MNEWYVRFIVRNGEESLVVLPSRLRLAMWLLRNLHRCRYVTFFASDFYENMYEEEP